MADGENLSAVEYEIQFGARHKYVQRRRVSRSRRASQTAAGEGKATLYPKSERVEFSLNFLGGRGVVIITTAGVATVEDFRVMNDALVEDPRFQPGTPILFDHSALDMTSLSADDVRRLGERPVMLGDRIGSSSIAVVVPSKVTFGLARMSHSRSTQSERTVRNFYTLAEALTWIRTHP
jgi:hypothetical protein